MLRTIYIDHSTMRDTTFTNENKGVLIITNMKEVWQKTPTKSVMRPIPTTPMIPTKRHDMVDLYTYASTSV